LSILHLYKKALFPYCTITVRSRLKKFGKLSQGDRLIAQPVRGALDIVFNNRKLATLAEVLEVKSDGGFTMLHLKGLTRVRIIGGNSVFSGMYDEIPVTGNDRQERLREELRKKAQELIFLINVDESDKLIHLLNFIVNLHQLTDFVSNYFVLKYPSRFTVFNEIDVEKRGHILLGILDGLIVELKRKSEKEHR